MSKQTQIKLSVSAKFDTTHSRWWSHTCTLGQWNPHDPSGQERFATPTEPGHGAANVPILSTSMRSVAFTLTLTGSGGHMVANCDFSSAINFKYHQPRLWSDLISPELRRLSRRCYFVLRAGLAPARYIGSVWQGLKSHGSGCMLHGQGGARAQRFGARRTAAPDRPGETRPESPRDDG